jgi:type I restriction enzyme R subunit
MTEFKQIIGRGTRVRDDYGKFFFNILDYTGSATRLFADPEFDGDPALVTEEEMNAEGESVSEPKVVEQEPAPQEPEEGEPVPPPTLPNFDDEERPPRKYYVDGGTVEIAAHLVYELDADGKRLAVKKFTDYTGEKVRSMYSSAAALRAKWSNAEERAAIIASLEQRGISFEELAEATKQPDADPFDLLCNVAYSAPIRTRRERADAVRLEGAFLGKFTNGARNVLNELLEKYVEFGTAQFQIPDILKVPPLSDHGNVMEIADLFGGGDRLREAVGELQQLLYVA